ncbi:hypothetical protein Q5M86_03930 [Brachyspira innocens]|uniref:Uncharacterized protein n=1 Tax=Brachyspira innocens TaxID=13264 RepID=A0ABT8YWP7_9SPIR|nr:hypothetical protein [Brachyspira innocens]MDO7019920.1 hypothetical protein [Brachyspira innocens]
MNEYVFFIVSAVILIIVVVSIILYRKRFNIDDIAFDIIEVDLLTMEEILKSFKRKEVIDILRNDDDLLAVVIKEHKNNGYRIICTLYDKREEEILKDFKFPLIFKAKDINEDLKNAFSDKDMIVLK